MLLNIFFNFSSFSRNCISVSVYLHELSLASNIYKSFCTVAAVPIYCKTQVHAACGARLWLLPVPRATLCPVISRRSFLSIVTRWPYWLCRSCTGLLFLIPLLLKIKPFDEWLYSWVMKSTHTGGIWEHLNAQCLNVSISFQNGRFSCRVTGSAYLMSDLQA